MVLNRIYVYRFSFNVHEKKKCQQKVVGVEEDRSCEMSYLVGFQRRIDS